MGLFERKKTPAIPKVDRRTVLLPVDNDWRDYAPYQRNYMDQRTGRFIPSTDVYVGDKLHVQINALGCKGTDLVPGTPVVGIFGDSVMQGVDLISIPAEVRIPGAQVLNAAVEGSTLERTVEIFTELRDKVPMVCAAVHTGWHNLMYNRADEAFWTQQLDLIQGPPLIAHFTLAADINAEAVERGYATIFDRPASQTPQEYLQSDYGAWLYSKEEYTDPVKLRFLMDKIQAFNRFIRSYCADRNRLLIDLDEVLRPPTYEAISTRFFDMIHLRPQFYSMAGQAIAAQLIPHVTPLLAAARDRGERAPEQERPRNGSAPTTGRNYPLW
jgi:hypothetical protein